MSDSSASLRARIASATDLQSMARTMKTVAAANIGQYERAMTALEVYYDSIQLALSLCLRASAIPASGPALTAGRVGAIVFGSDQGLVGQFNEAMRSFVLTTLAQHKGQAMLWPVGTRIAQALADTAMPLGAGFDLPRSIDGATMLVGQLLLEVQARCEHDGIGQVYVFHQYPAPGAQFAPRCQRLLPLDLAWQHELAARPWPGTMLPEALPGHAAALRASLDEYLFVALYRACAASQASENAARLAAMQRAEKNIGELLQQMVQSFQRQRQGSIDAELFDLLAGFESQPAL
jgi:F-type H+-transporting ATPase subunit gamma